ncbi:hypothetical protein HYG81_15130 [Natrinema zhouii]|uniref:Uncharacterized protein n=1 Tax=Natrinema zhouii TaxID=1710539 RepID=A0A7D6GUZ0_9EURY|nr:hypothetical protein [Natrinema zhouii]QLK25406.1 hypothetical protein HYG81_15130 [Natrinema zhouii]
MTELFRLTIPANFGSGSVEGVFEAFTNPTDTDEVRTGYLLDNSFDQALAILQGLLEDGEPDRKGIHLDLGGGQHAIDLRADVTSDATPDENGDPLQWGSSSDPAQFSATTATGGTALQKVQVFQHYVRVAGTDSLTPATLEYGEYSSSGVLEPLDVVFEQPSFERQSSDKYQFSAAFVETVDLGRSLDGSKQTEA